MEPTLVVAALWLLFGGTHVGLAVRPVRERLVARLGEKGFVLLFWIVAAVTFSLLALGYERFATRGLPGPALGAVAGLRPLLIGVLVLGLVLMASSFASYLRSPYAATFSGPRPWRVVGVARITRHPFFVGLALFATAHALLATRLSGTTFWAGFVLLATLGMVHVDRKLLAAHGEPFADYLRQTSALPFAAVLRGRQTLAWSDVPLAAIVVGIALAWLLRAVHATLTAHIGPISIAMVVGGAAVLSLQAVYAGTRRARRSAAVSSQPRQA
ncbi:MAG TPA: NnrU family protein [Candidatus Binatia bacterium]